MRAPGGPDLGARLRARVGPGAILERAPGRVNLIGEHTDYNDGFVLPAAIDRYAWVAAAPRADRKVVVHSENLGETVTLDLDERDPSPRRDWSDYPHGVARALLDAGIELRGASLRVSSEVPLGSGLSSSASLEVAVARALLAIARAELAPERLALLCTRAENEFVGTRCGVMDQMVASVGVPGRATLLDCRSLEHRPVAIPGSLRIVVCNSMVRHALSGGEYNRRREECEEAVRALTSVPGAPFIAALRDVDALDLAAHRDRLSETAYRRGRHVVQENRRVLETVAALERSDLAAVARLLVESHESLRDDFEVSCRELDLLVDLALASPGVHGARMTGGGFGGCTVNLVEALAVDEFRHHVAGRYRRATGLLPEVLVCAPAAPDPPG